MLITVYRNFNVIYNVSSVIIINVIYFKLDLSVCSFNLFLEIRVSFCFTFTSSLRHFERLFSGVVWYGDYDKALFIASALIKSGELYNCFYFLLASVFSYVLFVVLFFV